MSGTQEGKVADRGGTNRRCWEGYSLHDNVRWEDVLGKSLRSHGEHRERA